MDLLAFERKLDQTIMRKRLDIQEALKRPIKVGEGCLETYCNQQSRRALKIVSYPCKHMKNRNAQDFSGGSEPSLPLSVLFVLREWIYEEKKNIKLCFNKTEARFSPLCFRMNTELMLFLVAKAKATHFYLQYLQSSQVGCRGW